MHLTTSVAVLVGCVVVFIWRRSSSPKAKKVTSNSASAIAMASNATIPTYDVFVSFRGEDTRNSFTAFLFDALSQNGIHAFKDDTHLQKGESIAPELLLAIQGSGLFVVVFSKNYASSTWCLRELAHICNCTIQASPSRVLPIFYDVDPSELRKQSGYYGIAFAEHERRFRGDKEKMEELQRWREALKQVANISGWNIQNESQPAVIEKIVLEIKCRLGSKFQNLPKGNLVGMESCVEELEKCLELELVSDVRVVGICGMGGIGKTTLARALYEKISYQYDFHCFVDDVKEIYKKIGSLGVQKQLLSQCVNDKNIEICNASKGTYLIGTRLRNKRGLIVLDNVSRVEQLHMFTGSRETLLRECVGGGSRIIVISRDEHILRTHGVNHVYQVKPLNQDNAVQLFCKNAFKCDYILSGYKMLTHDVLSHAQGHPLAIQVIGNFLQGRNVSQWKSTLVRLNEIKSEDIMKVLRISYDDLEEKDKEIFLDIACFFSRDYSYKYSERYVKEILDFRGFNPEIGLPILVDKSLITISHGKIYMHRLLRDLGKCIVREKSPKEPRNWSRLWDWKDLYEVLSNNMKAKNLEAIVVEDKTWMFFETTMRVDALSKMKNLKLLMFPEYKQWKPHNLIELDLSRSNIQHLWDSTQPIPKLRRLNLSFCVNLIEVPDFSEALNLESLDLSGCTRLSRFHPSIGFPRNLTNLRLWDCKSLVELPHFEQALNLEYLDLTGCEQLKQLPSSIGRLRKLKFSLDLEECKSLTDLPHFAEDLNFSWLNLRGCIELRQIHPSIGHLRKLSGLVLQNCKSLVKLPDFAEDLNLRQLNLEGCEQLRQIHPSIGHLTKLEVLNLKDCKSLVKLPDFAEDLNLRELNLEGCEQLRQIHPSIGHLTKLVKLNLKDCKSLESLPNNILRLSSLQYLSLFGCSKLYNIRSSEEQRGAGHLKKLRIGEAPSRSQSIFSFFKKGLPWPSVAFDKSLEDAHKDSVRCLLPSLPIFPCMRELDLSFCNLLKIPDAFVNFQCLEELYLMGNNFETLPSLKELSKLLHLNLQHCKRLKYLPELPSRTDLFWWNWTTVDDYEYGLGLNIFNCPELAERDRCPNNCFSWMMQIAHPDLLPLVPPISSIIPGSEIPSWFEKQHLGMGNVINIGRSHFMQHYKNWIGLALSVIFVVHKERRIPPPDMEQPSILSITCGPSIPPQQRKKERPSPYIPVLFREDLVTDESDHLWLFYFTLDLFDDRNFDELEVKCRSRDLLHDQDLVVEVKKYGYRWVHKHDLELLNRSSLKRNFSEIKEN
ncbi:Disease resistance protein TAO1 isoform D [Glycine soja]|uniref:Disease resistance protein TAO1 isoform A n=1 Tax=Glycine soja TaxID=3848 RepID=A0A445KEM7_GLYSO|nr:Disease resistance protein TAO1 isoform A [Glycine soja]RZC09311.1 Disease resistance protein TAO1 isoform B [Glycine soja]RZC09312.1 Disease resistance protein TAO1 isoform C [Glycine soja]RZC09313.1 Disease resistance protein TAO1 isoform D [Glycine soja]